MRPASALLKVRDLRVNARAAEGDLNLVSGVALDLELGETLALVGESGCGKSMTALALMGLLPSACSMTTSTYDFDGIDIARAGSMPDELRGNRVAMIFQDPNTALNPSFTIGDQLEEAWLRHRPGGRAAARARATTLLERVGISSPARRLNQYPHQLSGGLRQRAMIAMALMCEPRLLVADEPTTALDVTIQAQVLRLLKELQRELGLGMLLISHDIGVVAAMANQIAVMYAGEIVETGLTSEVLAGPLHPYTRGLMRCLPDTSDRQSRLMTIPGSVPPPEQRGPGCRFANRCTIAVEACRSAPVGLASYSDHRTVRCLRADYVELKGTGIPQEAARGVEASGEHKDDPILEANAVIHDFTIRRGWFARAGRLQALRGISFEVRRNETVAIVGESGCGKSTLARIALGLLTPSSGDIRIAGGQLHKLARREIARLVQPVFQDPYASLAPHRTIVDAVMVPLQVSRIGTAAERRRRALEILEKVGLPSHLAERLPAELSGGQQQRVAIARALVLRPQVLICDEPTSALDVSVQAQILNLLRDLKQELGLAMLLITHNIGVVRQVADRVMVMYLGRVVEQGAVDRVLDRSRHPYTRLLISSVLEPSRRNNIAPGLGEDSHFPDPFNLPAGCAFHPRCINRSAICSQVLPGEKVLDTGFVACHHPMPHPHELTAEAREQEWNRTS